MSFTVSYNPMQTRLKTRLLKLGLILFGVACGLLSPHTPSAFAFFWQEPMPENAVIAIPNNASNWWQQVPDTQFQTVAETVLQHNVSLKLAYERVKTARYEAKISLGREFPWLSIDPTFSRQRNSATLTAPSGSALSGTGPRLFAPGATVNLYNLPLKASWELDITGKNRLKTKALQQAMRAVSFDETATQQAIIYQLATAYTQWQALEQRIALQKILIQQQAEKIALEQRRAQAGLSRGDTLAILRAQQQQNEAQLSGFQTQQAITLHQCRTLAADQTLRLQPDANALPVWLTHFTSPLTPMAISTPADLLSSRPDIQAAEALLKRANLNVQVAKRELFPKLTVGGQFGFASSDLSRLLDWQSHLAAVTAGATQQLFTGLADYHAYQQQKSYAAQALLQYHQTVLTAFAQVEDALSGVLKAKTAVQTSQEQVRQAQLVSTLAEKRYQAGLSAKDEPLTQQQQVTRETAHQCEAQQEAIQARLNLLLALGS